MGSPRSRTASIKARSWVGGRCGGRSNVSSPASRTFPRNPFRLIRLYRLYRLKRQRLVPGGVVAMWKKLIAAMAGCGLSATFALAQPQLGARGENANRPTALESEGFGDAIFAPARLAKL